MLLRKNKIIRKVWFSGCFLGAGLLFGFLSGCPGTPPADLDGFIQYHMKKAHIPGLSAAVFSKDAVVWAKGYGWANIREQWTVAPETLFQLASISKLVTATAAMQLAETGRLDLDADINAVLPFVIRNPYCPETAITARMLLTHTSSLLDNEDVYGELYEYGADSPISLREVLEGFYTPSGRWYHASECFLKKCPGSEWSYSNLGFALLGYLVEVVSGEPFDAYCNAHIFTPLGMSETRWFLRDLDPVHIAMPYRDLSFLGIPIYCPYGQYGYPDYPSGQLRTSTLQFSRFFRAFMNHGILEDVRILQPGTVQQMLTVQDRDIAAHQGLGWILLEQKDGSVEAGHGGGDQGVHTMAWFKPDQSTGVLIFTSGDTADFFMNRVQKRIEAVTAIQERLFKDAENH